MGVSAVFVEQLNVFEGQVHADTDDWSGRFRDDGRKTMPGIAWEGHDEGDMNPMPLRAHSPVLEKSPGCLLTI